MNLSRKVSWPCRALSELSAKYMLVQKTRHGELAQVRGFTGKPRRFKSEELQWLFGSKRDTPEVVVPMKDRVVLGPSGFPWKFASAVIFERGPIILPQPKPIEELYEENKFQHFNRFAARRDERLQPVSEMERDSFKANQKRGELFVPAPRITEADKTNDLRSLHRKLDRTLYFVLKRTETSEFYQFPQRVTGDDEKLRDSAEKALKAVLGDQKVQTYYTTYRPHAHLEYSYSAEYQKKNQVHGVKIFFYPAELITGEVSKLRHGVDFLWLTAEELKEYISPQYYKAVEDVLVFDPDAQNLKPPTKVFRRYPEARRRPEARGPTEEQAAGPAQ
ncbi:39S ribosomal protein L46, mitochondrial [Porphyridium purpureum]|uniref:39S ribosomal protein L46, mitochondrial n=1 Tax=Porphyridium purpureum TaxID=35688 RepID=A0A5J4Z5A8_PORPP|nr:39S ribosomal protein L46, mitochondrial [Porphyridium purpureum]|eukprot:POR4590..scf295_1